MFTHCQVKKLVGKVPAAGDPPSTIRLRTKTTLDSLDPASFVTPKRKQTGGSPATTNTSDTPGSKFLGYDETLLI